MNKVCLDGRVVGCSKVFTRSDNTPTCLLRVDAGLGEFLVDVAGDAAFDAEAESSPGKMVYISGHLKASNFYEHRFSIVADALSFGDASPVYTDVDDFAESVLEGDGCV
jgi:hypothetical protein